jgi:hypothetical protein
MCACACATTHAPTPSRLVTQLTRTIALTCEAYAYGKGYAYNKGSAPVIPIIAPRPLLHSAFSFQVFPRKSSSSPTWQVRARKVSMQACASKGRQQGSSSTGEAFGGARGTHDEGPAVRGARHSKGKAQAGSSTGGRGGWRHARFVALKRGQAGMWVGVVPAWWSRRPATRRTRRGSAPRPSRRGRRRQRPSRGPA